MPKRNYVSSARASAAAETRERIIAAGARLLRKDASIANFSLDVVAKAAGVTRLTVYNQFGSRRGLLEAVFDDIAHQGGLFELAEAPAVRGDEWKLIDRHEIGPIELSREHQQVRIGDGVPIAMHVVPKIRSN